MRKQLLLLLCLSLLSLPGIARVVTGVVTQSSDGEMLQNLEYTFEHDKYE